LRCRAGRTGERRCRQADGCAVAESADVARTARENLRISASACQVCRLHAFARRFSRCPAFGRGAPKAVRLIPRRATGLATDFGCSACIAGLANLRRTAISNGRRLISRLNLDAPRIPTKSSKPRQKWRGFFVRTKHAIARFREPNQRWASCQASPG
jgi:hypothetical protein